MMAKNYFEEVIDRMMIEEVSGLDQEIKETLLSLPLEKKRLAILSILDKNRNLYIKIKNTIVEGKTTKTEYVKSVVEMLREYVQVGDVEKKKFGEVMTPIHLVEDMMDTLPVEVWSNPKLKWLDPCSGVGVFSAVVVNRLMNGLKDVIVDENERYKHIMEEMIYVCELQPKNMFLFLVAFDTLDKVYLNVYTGSYLDEKFDEHCKDEWGVEKFDIVMMNPPFNTDKKNSALLERTSGSTNTGALYVDFVEKGLKSSKKLFSCILPSVWTGDPKRKVTKMIMNNGLYYCSDSSFYEMDITQSTCFICLDKTIKEKNGYIIKNLNDKWVCNNYNIIPIKSSSLIDSILNKTSKENTLGKIWQRSQQFPRHMLGIGDIKIVEIVGSSKTNSPVFSTINDEKATKQSHYNKWKVVVNCNGSLSGRETFKIVGPEYSTSTSVVSFGAESEEEVNNLLSYLKTDLVSFLIKQVKIMQCNSLTVFKNIPLVDLSKNWTNEEVNKYFNLTEKEIEIITNN